MDYLTFMNSYFKIGRKCITIFSDLGFNISLCKMNCIITIIYLSCRHNDMLILFIFYPFKIVFINPLIELS